MSRALFVLCRIGAAIALLAVATYYLLASIPFAYYHFLQFPHFWWLPAFIRVHPAVMLGGVGALLVTLRGLPAGLRFWTRLLAITGLTTSLWMTAMLLWPILQTYENAEFMCFAPLVLLALGGGLGVARSRDALASVPASRSDTGGSLATAVLAGALTAAIYLVRGLLVSGGVDGLTRAQIFVAAMITVATHEAVFLVPALITAGCRLVAARRSWSQWTMSLALQACAAAFTAWFIRRCVLTALLLSDRLAFALSIVLAVALVLYWRALFPSPSRVSMRRWPPIVISTLLLVAGVGIVPGLLRLADWGLTLQKVVVLATWAAAFVLFAALAPKSRLRRVLTGAVMACLTLALGAAVLRAGTESGSANVADSQVDVALTVDQYASFDVSFTAALDLFRPVITDHEFYDTLRTLADATADSSLRAVPLRVSGGRATESAPRPHIFVFVVDSLRPDYVSAYNPDVWFTPAMKAFAEQSIVMRRAFTRYSGTGLSQPALWAGGLIPRAMYIKPFSAVDNLERLLALAGYRRYISVDQILSLILEDQSSLVRLDAHLAHPDRLEEAFKFDICKTVSELTSRLDSDQRDGRPIFFYSQPQNLHIRLVPHSKYTSAEMVRRGSSEFFAPSVATIGEIDRCFGNFIAYLKRASLYDDSVIILTSDHGDAYGEGGQWGHAFYLGPETLRIPLIMHVPESLRRQRTWDPDAIAWLTDVTPTLYDLLGYEVSPANALLGQPLLRRDDADGPAQIHDRYLVQSSYARVFGLLGGQADWLYVVDANHLREQFFDLRNGRGSLRSLPQADRIKYRKWLVAELGTLNAYYAPDRETK